MNKKNACKLLAWTMTAALTLTAGSSTGMTVSAKSTSKVSTKWYTISKKPGTYEQKVTLKVTAKKGFQVYYTTNGKFRLKKKLNSGKSTRIAITKTTTLSVYAVQKGKKVTAAQLNSKKIKKKASYKNYYYKITTGSANPETSSNTSTAGTTTTSLPGGIIEAKGTDTVLTFASCDETHIGSLSVTDAMDADTTDYGSEDPSDGISCKGTLNIQSGTYEISSNGDCLKGTGSDGSGGVYITGGSLSLTSALGNGIKSKNGNISISGGTAKILSTKEDGINANNYTVSISGGKVIITHCQGDDIQGEWVSISGDDTYVDITTEYENAGVNYYSNSLGSGNYNTLTSNNFTKTETVNVDTGSHKGIKAGTKSSTYSYTSVSDDSTLTAGQTYSTEASGGLVITGGTILVDTTQTGIKYNGGGGGMGGGNSKP